MLDNITRRAIAKIKRTEFEIKSKVLIWAASTHLFGPRRIFLREDEVALVCMIKNASYYIEVLIEHHRSLGVRHFLFIDNGSEDSTIEKLILYKDVTVISNKLPVAKYESKMRANIARRVIKGGWFLFVDSDELIEMTHDTHRDIKYYTRYCNYKGYDAVIGQCLDLFTFSPLSETEKWGYKESVLKFNLYSVENITDFDYHDENIGFSWFLRENRISNPHIKIKFGGIRREIFQENCCLSNHRLIKNASHIELYSHPHCSSNVSCADFSILLRHYKFAGKYRSREQTQIHNRTWTHGEDLKRISVVSNKKFAFSADNAKRFTGTESLLAQGFLVSSASFIEHFPLSKKAEMEDKL